MPQEQRFGAEIGGWRFDISYIFADPCAKFIGVFYRDSTDNHIGIKVDRIGDFAINGITVEVPVAIQVGIIKVARDIVFIGIVTRAAILRESKSNRDEFIRAVAFIAQQKH